MAIRVENPDGSLRKAGANGATRVAPDGRSVVWDRNGRLAATGGHSVHAAVAFRVTVSYDGEQPAYAVVPFDGAVARASYLGFEEVDKGVLMVRFSLDRPVPEENRVTPTGVRVPGIQEINPFAPVLPSVAAPDDELRLIVVANQSSPEQGSPPRSLDFHAAVYVRR
jgi:hypothetical protein